MKALILTLSLFFSDSTSAQVAKPAEDMNWLQEEWNKEYATLTEDISLPCNKIFIVNMEGEVLMELEMSLLNNKMFTDIQYTAYRTSDFLFESLSGDKYYLAD